MPRPQRLLAAIFPELLITWSVSAIVSMRAARATEDVATALVLVVLLFPLLVASGLAMRPRSR